LISLRRTSKITAAAIAAAVTKRYTAARIARAYTHALLGMTHQDIACIRQAFPLYIRPLGIKKEAAGLLGQMAKRCTAPYISRPAAYRPEGEAQQLLWSTELRTTDIYSLALDLPAGQDFTQGLIVR